MEFLQMLWLPDRSSRNLSTFSFEEHHQFDNQNDNHNEFEGEGSALVKLFHHKSVEVVSSVELFLYQGLIVGDADPVGSHPVQARRKHVAEELDGIIHPFSQFSHFEHEALQPLRGAGQSPASQ